MPSVEEFLKRRVLPEHRTIVESIRQLMRQTAPQAEEVLTYGILGWRANRIIAVVSPTKEDITFAFDERVNVFVGPNNCGKSLR